MEMAKIHGYGTFDASKNKWKIRTAELRESATVSQLNKRYGTNIPNNEEKSRHLWERYLAELRGQVKEVGQVQREVEDYRRFLQFLQKEDPNSVKEDELKALNEVKPGTELYNHFKMPELNSEAFELANRLGINPWNVGNAKALSRSLGLSKPKEPGYSLKLEIADYLTEYRKSRAVSSVKASEYALGMFLEICGDIPISKINGKHYSTFLSKIKSLENKYKPGSTVAVNTAICYRRNLNAFLARMEATFNVPMHFRKLKDNELEAEDGDKVQYTVEQLRTALQFAEGTDRTALLLGINCGFYWGDIFALKEEHFDGTYLRKGREKNKKKKGIVGVWKLFPETKAVLKFGLNRSIVHQFNKFCRKHELPEHKALRKTIAQMIQDDFGSETGARLFRCEKVAGTHGKFYIENFTEKQQKELDLALEFVRNKLFG